MRLKSTDRRRSAGKAASRTPFVESGDRRKVKLIQMEQTRVKNEATLKTQIKGIKMTNKCVQNLFVACFKIERNEGSVYLNFSDCFEI